MKTNLEWQIKEIGRYVVVLSPSYELLQFHFQIKIIQKLRTKNILLNALSLGIINKNCKKRKLQIIPRG